MPTTEVLVKCDHCGRRLILVREIADQLDALNRVACNDLHIPCLLKEVQQ